MKNGELGEAIENFVGVIGSKVTRHDVSFPANSPGMRDLLPGYSEVEFFLPISTLLGIVTFSFPRDENKNHPKGVAAIRMKKALKKPTIERISFLQ